MEDKIIMNTALTLVKNSCEIIMHGAIEANTPKVKNTFTESLTKLIEMQGMIFKEMESAGLYNTESATASKISKTRSKYESTLIN